MGHPWPKARSSPIAACLGYRGQHKTVLISGGDGGKVTYGDMWLLDPQSGKMDKVRDQKSTSKFS